MVPYHLFFYILPSVFGKEKLTPSRSPCALVITNFVQPETDQTLFWILVEIPKFQKIPDVSGGGFGTCV